MYLHAEDDYSEVETIRFNEAYAWDDHQLKPFFYSWIIYYYRFLRTFFISGQEPDTGPISSYSHASPSLSHIAEYPVALEISLLLRTQLIHQASDLGAMRPISVSNSCQYPTALPRNCNRDKIPKLVPLRVGFRLKM